jgi:hypothetical protein
MVNGEWPHFPELGLRSNGVRYSVRPDSNPISRKRGRGSIALFVALTLAACSQPPTASTPAANAAVYADDFESHTAGQLPAPPWKEEMYNSGANIVVDGQHAYSGKQAMHVITPRDNKKRRGYVALHLNPKFTAVEHEMYGRAMVWLEAAPVPVPGGPPVQWTLLQGEGRSADDRYNSIYRLALLQDGGTRLMANFETTPPLATDCKQHSTRQLPLKTWACVEWHFDVKDNELQYWLDGEELLHVRGRGNADSACRGNDLDGVWLAPPKFNSFYIGLERYHDSANDQNLWIDDVVLSTARVGCPTIQGRNQ